ncbi:hypothetical protein NBCG_02531 [Nocardioidaceae bacterium Broad-1]|nr:hypothetical protein NBCG_02531 [Nocardioidaceae bacterium Broad-1]
MWDVIGINSLHLSHDLPCPRCGHPAHIYLACGDGCDCEPTLLPGSALPADHLTPRVEAA